MNPASRINLIRSPAAATRLEAAHAWLLAAADGKREMLLLTAHPNAGDLGRKIAIARGALAGLHQLTMNRLAAILSIEQMSAAGLAVATPLASEAVATRAVFQIKPSGRLAWFEPILDRPVSRGRWCELYPSCASTGLARMRWRGWNASGHRSPHSCSNSKRNSPPPS